MTEEIRRAAVQAIRAGFGLPVYGARVPQGAKRPCFTAEVTESSQTPLLNRRAERQVRLRIRYYGGEADATADAVVTERLLAALRIIGTAERFAAGEMRQEKTADGVCVEVGYRFHVIYDGEEEAKMQRLTYNGRRACGYEEEADIQQGAVEQE